MGIMVLSLAARVGDIGYLPQCNSLLWDPASRTLSSKVNINVIIHKAFSITCFCTESLVDGKSELGCWVQRGASAAKPMNISSWPCACMEV